VIENATPPPVPKEDNLAADLLSMLSEAGLTSVQQQTLLDKLVPYLVERDHKILMHGIDTGRANA
jgi:hypothetical protein